MRTRTAARGFTLVELMVVVAIIGVTGAAGITVYRRSARSEAAPSTARALYGMVAEARHAALALGAQTRIVLAVTPTRIISEQRQPDGTWVPMATYVVPPTVQLCAPRASALLGSVAVSSVTCPLSARTTICVAGSGQTTLSADDNCPGTSSGVTYFLRAAGATTTQPYKIVVYGLTGLARIRDLW